MCSDIRHLCDDISKKDFFLFMNVAHVVIRTLLKELPGKLTIANNRHRERLKLIFISSRMQVSMTTCRVLRFS